MTVPPLLSWWRHLPTPTQRLAACTNDPPSSGNLKNTSCGVAGDLRPHVVWFGEMPLYMDEIQAALMQAEVFAAIGTSGNVYPAAGFAALASRAGAHCVEINLEPSQVAGDFDEKVYGRASEAVPQWIASLKV